MIADVLVIDSENQFLKKVLNICNLGQIAIVRYKKQANNYLKQ
jgi:hypothetical protein